ncbi:hypothetical protein [Cohaesibacter haloalkalitolerans]|uniref:hypothetical protein n=1 Tax=Cohaesibacter haloalkalitolerans TaxID=1162980 RepID=UPI000E658198|nr:hypothetical protein [Cohaesibacter haloalkalitolerans]
MSNHINGLAEGILSTRVAALAEGLEAAAASQGLALNVETSHSDGQTELHLSGVGLVRDTFGDRDIAPAAPLASLLQELAYHRRQS